MEGILVAYSIVPYDATFEARYELKILLNELEELFPNISSVEMHIAPSGLNGLILVDLRDYMRDKDDQFKGKFREEFLRKFEEMKEGGEIRYIVKITFFDYLVETDVSKIAEKIKNYKNVIDDRWRLTIRTRKMVGDRKEFIQKLAEPIEQPVDLKNPVYVIFVEVLGDLTGVYLEKKV